MLEVTIVPDSPVADIFASKCCGGGLPDQNLEIRIVNRGTTDVAVESRFRLEGDEGILDWRAVCPLGGRRVAPGDVAALYANLDPGLLAHYRILALFEENGAVRRFPLQGGGEIAGDGGGAR
jgi:hypothetical protein